MKKNYILSFFLTFSICSFTFAQEMLLNGDLENWDNDTSPTSWTKSESLTKSTEAHGGSFSAFRNAGSSTKKLSQTIDGITPGASYTISFWYKVTAGDEEDARIWCTWKNGITSVYHVGTSQNATEDPLRGPENGYLSNNGGVWSKHEVTVTAPAGVDAFYYEVRSYTNSLTYWDDLSFIKNATASVEKNTIEGFTTYPNPITNNSFTIKSSSTKEKSVAIYNLLGKKVFAANFSGEKKDIDVATFTSGIYIVKVTEDTKTATKKIVIR
ncbi:T9SS type A sorting domain-containing protein [Polaribacter sp.]|uniref:T9SS type A sorting domain-containing protein n=1 Tax=Polaribacter sp. TaxID=1920175 RepID=UPI003EFB312C